LSISQKALGTLPEDGNVMPKHVEATIHNLKTERIIGVFVGFSRMFLLGVLIFKGLTARSLYKSFGDKGLISGQEHEHIVSRSHNFVSEGNLKTSYQPTHPVTVY
jgi:hypothetical protein